MSKIKTITATTTEQEITFDATYQFVWFRSLGDGDVLVSDHSGIVAGTDDVTLVKGGDSTRITVPYNKTVYVKAVSDSVDMEIHAQNFSDAPFECGSGGSGGGGSITIDPTPTQGSSNAVSSGGVYTALQGVSPIDYSTTEQDTGRKWIDGKPVYQKTLVSSFSGMLQHEQWIVLESIAGVSDILDILDIKVTLKDTYGGNNYAAFHSGALFRIVSDNLQIFSFNDWGVSNVIVTIQYTKTTDTVE